MLKHCVLWFKLLRDARSMRFLPSFGLPLLIHMCQIWQWLVFVSGIYLSFKSIYCPALKSCTSQRTSLKAAASEKKAGKKTFIQISWCGPHFDLRQNAKCITIFGLRVISYIHLHFSFAWPFDTFALRATQFISLLSNIKTYWFLSLSTRKERNRLNPKNKRKSKSKNHKKKFGLKFRISLR